MSTREDARSLTPVWPPSSVAEAVAGLAVAAGLAERPATIIALPSGVAPPDDATTEHLLAATAMPMGVEVEALEVRYADVPAMLRAAAPVLLRLPRGFVAVVRAGRRSARILGPDQRLHTVSTASLAAEVRASVDGGGNQSIDRLLDAAAVTGVRRARALACLVDARRGAERLRNAWLLRRGTFTSFAGTLARAGVGRRVVALVGAHLLGVLAMLGAWWMLGASALSGRADEGLLAGWALLLATLIPCRATVVWLQADLAARVGALFKRRLLVGALAIDPDTLRADGAGQTLGRAVEANALEQLLLSGAFMGLFAVVEIAVALALLTAGAGGVGQAGLYVGVLAAAAALGKVLHGRRLVWTDARLAMTDDLVEQMVGHRTRLVQQPLADWHGTEDVAVAHAHALAARMDRATVALLVLPRTWLLVSVLGLIPSFVGGAATPASLAVAVAGVLFGASALAKLVNVAADLAGAAIGWRRVAPVFRAASRPPAFGSPERTLAGAASGSVAIDAQGLRYTHAGRSEPVLRGISLRIAAGERILLEGPSGGGKSTLAAVLAGLRRPAEGLLLQGGLDVPTLGEEGWRRRVVLAPQFHENHLVTETLAFNLLMGRGWPPTDDDVREAHDLCVELGLGPLLERMPAGLGQMIGEGGWQLSHGERGRVYLARALLQRADVVILDESFAALDPETLDKAMACARKWAPTLLVISHA